MAVQPEHPAAGEAVDRLDHRGAVLGEERPDGGRVGGDDGRRDQVGEAQREEVLADRPADREGR